MVQADFATRLENVLISPDATIAQAVRQLESAGTRALLVADEERQLCALLTDGDVRRAILADVPFDRPCVSIGNPTPITAGPDVTRGEALEIMDRGREDFLVNELPVVNDDGSIVGLLLRSDLDAGYLPELSAVIMAGGFGKRLMPLTENVPKPMLPVGDRPLLERTIDRLREAGVQRVAISTHHLADRIIDHFGNGAAHGVELGYLSEDQPLGTAGALRLLEDVRAPMVVINGDVLTGVDFRGMLAYHREHDAAVTVGVRRCELQIPYGVLECEGPLIRGVSEKPRQSFLINAGVYLIEPSALGSIPEGRRFDMTDLMAALIAEGKRVVSFPIMEYWLDIGQPADYEQAQVDIRMARLER
jgi:Nucleoside-diphosphate-sugar pyrophosphorylase involved in lipopolysaccharide biosynthesis/translation initiation factor 2B, gamma/epsilon subunits (eIF-2Bgamma/eIF-2Bepsilon)